MNPRYKSSTQWTAFPTDFNKQICELFEQSFEKDLAGEKKIIVEGKIFKKEIALRVGLQNKGEIRCFNFEASIDLPQVDNQKDLSKINPLEEAIDQNSYVTQPPDEEKIMKTVSIMIDAIATLMNEYFENDEDLELPYTWSEMKFQGQSVWIQHSSTNPDLEAEADALLGLSSEGLLKNPEDEKSNDILDATEEEFDEFAEELSKGPQMFKTKKKDDLH